MILDKPHGEPSRLFQVTLSTHLHEHAGADPNESLQKGGPRAQGMPSPPYALPTVPLGFLVCVFLSNVSPPRCCPMNTQKSQLTADQTPRHQPDLSSHSDSAPASHVGLTSLRGGLLPYTTGSCFLPQTLVAI